MKIFLFVFLSIFILSEKSFGEDLRSRDQEGGYYCLMRGKGYYAYAGKINPNGEKIRWGYSGENSGIRGEYTNSTVMYIDEMPKGKEREIHNSLKNGDILCMKRWGWREGEK